MKTIKFIVFFSLCVLLSCKEDLNYLTLGIAVQASFYEDEVQVLIDGLEIINEKLQTNHLLGVCHINGDLGVTLKLKEGDHSIKVVVNKKESKTERFSLTKDQYVGINYDERTREIFFVYSDHPFMYD